MHSNNDRIDDLLADWAEERPDLKNDALSIALRIQTLAKSFAEFVNDDLSMFDLEWWEYDVLSALRRRGSPFQLAATEIAEDTMLSAGAMTNRIDRLRDRGLVERVEDPADRRRVLVRLTREGLRLIDRATEARFQSAESALKDLTANQREQLARLLRRLTVSHSG